MLEVDRKLLYCYVVRRFKFYDVIINIFFCDVN